MKQIKNVAYIHDLGGMETADHRKIKSGVLYRSAYLSEVDQKGKDYLVNVLKIKHVFDLRTPDEVTYKPEDILLPEIKLHLIPLADNKDNPAVTKENRLEVLNALVALPGGMRGHILDLYRVLINSEMAKNGYKEVFRLLLENKGEPVDIHCTQGKDRTGITLYLILSALGVKEEDIMKLYLSFNRRARIKRIIYFLGMNIRFSFKKAVALNDTLTAKRIYLETAIKEVNEIYGGVQSYLSKELGVGEKEIATLKSIYLE